MSISHASIPLRGFGPPAGSAAQTPSRTIAARLVALADRLYDWQARAAERRQLAMLDDRALKDIGLSRADVAAESAKPAWRP